MKKLLLLLILLLASFISESQILPGEPVGGFPKETTAQIKAISTIESLIAIALTKRYFITMLDLNG